MESLYCAWYIGAVPVKGDMMKTRLLSDIASDIQADWKNPYFGAVPYLDAMSTLSSIDDAYGMDSAKYIVVYFLSNATTWRGPVARDIKKELKKLAGIK